MSAESDRLAMLEEDLRQLWAVAEDVVTDNRELCSRALGQCACSINRLAALLAYPLHAVPVVSTDPPLPDGMTWLHLKVAVPAAVPDQVALEVLATDAAAEAANAARRAVLDRG